RTLIGHLVRADQIASTHLDARDTELQRDGVHQPLAHEIGLVTAGRAISGRWRLVGQAEMSVHAEMRQTIRAREHATRGVGDARAMGTYISALIVEEIVIDAD